jgi:hypothetical protein
MSQPPCVYDCYICASFCWCLEQNDKLSLNCTESVNNKNVWRWLSSGLLHRVVWLWVIALIMEAAGTSEVSVNFYQTTRRNNPENSHLHTHRCENLKSYNSSVVIPILKRRSTFNCILLPIFDVSEFNSLGRMCCPWWQCHEAPVIKMACTIEEHVFLVKIFYQTLLLSRFSVNSEWNLSAGKHQAGLQ